MSAPPSMNPRLAAIEPSLIRAIAAKRRSSSIDLGLGEPVLRPDPRHFLAASAWVAENGCPYSPNAGTEELRAAISGHYAYPGCGEASAVCVTTGSQEALYATLTALLDPRTDELAVVEPAFGSYRKIAELAGISVRTIGLDAERDFAFDPDRIVAGLGERTRMLALCSPCNPTGRVLREAEAQALADALLARPGPPVTVLFDEVYRELSYLDDGASFARLYPYTVSINSLSKSNALTGLRLGWAIAPPPMIAAITKMHSWISSAASTFAQRVAIEIFREPAGLRAQSETYRRQCAAVIAVLERSGLAFAPCEGSFYAFVRPPEVNDSLEAALRLAEDDDVIAVPGRAFGRDCERYLRISWVAPLERVEEGIARIARRYGSG